LQRLDGPVRGNGKIVQELEGEFRGSGWNVLKLIWGSNWDPLLARDASGLLRRLMMECVDGEYQNFKAKGGAYTREHFFGKYPELKEMVANMSDDDIWMLNRGGHDPLKVFNAYQAAMAHKDQPTVILAKTIKGYGMGKSGEGLNITHQQKKLDDEALKEFRDRFNIPVSDADIASVLGVSREAVRVRKLRLTQAAGMRAVEGRVPARAAGGIASKRRQGDV
jgi:pyruvate dehydrogenase E1 component